MHILQSMIIALIVALVFLAIGELILRLLGITGAGGRSARGEY